MRQTSWIAQSGEPCVVGQESLSGGIESPKEARPPSAPVAPEAWRQVYMSIGLALLAGAVIGLLYGPQALLQYFSVYLVEQASGNSLR
jgi:hypothetical protein